MSNTGQKILDGIIKSNLCEARCVDNEEHDIVTVWSSGAAEQLEAIASAALGFSYLLSERDKLREENRSLKNSAQFNEGIRKDLEEALLHHSRLDVDKLKRELAEAKAEARQQEKDKHEAVVEQGRLATKCDSLAQRLAKWRECAENLLGRVAAKAADETGRYGKPNPKDVEAIAAFERLQKEEPK